MASTCQPLPSLYSRGVSFGDAYFSIVLRLCALECGSQAVLRCYPGPEPTRSDSMEQIINANLHDAGVKLHASRIDHERSGRGRLLVDGAEIEIIVFELGGDVACEGVFNAGTRHPSGSHEGTRCGTAVCRTDVDLVTSPSCASLAVEQRVIQGPSKAAGGGAEPVVLQRTGQRKPRERIRSRA